MGEARKARSLATRLIVLVGAVLLPMVIFGGCVAWVYTRQERAGVEGALRVAGGNLALSVDAQFTDYITSLQTLATSASLHTNDLGGFYSVAVRARAANPDWLAITLAEPSGQVILSDARPFGERLSQLTVPDVAPRVIETGRPAVSNLVVGPVTREPIIAVAVPVTRDGQTPYVLSAAVSPARLSDALGRRQLPPGWSAAILDRQRVTVARKGEAPERLGEPVPPEHLARITTAGAGPVLATTAEGSRWYTAVTRSPQLGWTVLLHVPVAEFEAPLHRTLLLLGGGGLVLALIAVLLALRVGGRIAGGVAALADTATALGRGEPIRRAPSSIIEVEQVARALERSAAERAQAEASLRERERFYASLLENALDMVSVVDAAGRIVYDSPAVTRILGFTPEERRGQSRMDRTHPDDQPAATARMAERFRAPGTPQGGRLRVRHHDGSWRHLETVGQVFVDAAGTPLAVVNSRDVTDRMRADAQLALQASALAAAANTMVITDREGTIVWVNPAFTTLTGYAAEEVLGQTLRLLKSGAQAPAFYQALWSTILAGQVWQGELVNRRKDGSLYHAEMTITPVRGEDGALTHFIAVQQDISARVAAEAQQRQTQKVEVVGELAGGIAHDFNNLLTVILGRCHLLHVRLPPEGPERRDVELIQRTGERAAALTGQLLAFSRRQVIAPGVVNGNEVVQGLAPMLQRLIGEDIELILEPGAGLWPVMADPHQLEQVVMNLAVNARDAMPEGGRLRVATANVELDEAFVQGHPGATAGPHACLTVSDTGVGMDEATRARIFEPFFTTKAVGKGTGLGLSTVHGIVRQHGGAIEVESAPGQGATFRLYLPRTQAPAEALAPGAAGAPTPRGTETILLVEDDAEVRRLATEFLTGSGYTVLGIAHPDKAGDVLAAHPGPIHLLLSDVVMPGMSGPALAARLSAERPALRVLFISGYTADALEPRGALAPGTTLLHKPFTPENLGRKVREVLDRG